MGKTEPTPDIKFTNPLGDESEDEVSPKSPAGADGLEQRDRSGSPPEGSEKVTLGNSSDLLQNMLSMDQTARSTDYEDERERRYMEAVDYMDEKGIIAPDSEFRHHWDLIQVPLLIYVGIAVPYRIGFSHDTAPGDFGFLVDVFVDLFFIADIYMNFRTAVWNRHGELTYERKGIARQYLKVRAHALRARTAGRTFGGYSARADGSENRAAALARTGLVHCRHARLPTDQLRPADNRSYGLLRLVGGTREQGLPRAATVQAAQAATAGAAQANHRAVRGGVLRTSVWLCLDEDRHRSAHDRTLAGVPVVWCWRYASAPPFSLVPRHWPPTLCFGSSSPLHGPRGVQRLRTSMP